MARGPLKQKIKKGKKGQLRLKGISGIAVRPTEQQIKIAEGLAKGLKKKQALIEAGVSEENARSNSRELTEQPGVLKALDEALTKAGVNVDRIARVINDGLSAKKVISATVLTFKPKKDQPDVIDAGSLDDFEKRFVSVDDHAVRHQFARTASELMDLFPSKRVDLSVEKKPIEKMTDAQIDAEIEKLLAEKAKA